MINSKILIIGLVSLFSTLTLGSKCRQDTISKVLLCYYESEQSISHVNICNCTHLVFTNAVKKGENFTLEIDEGVKKTLTTVKERKDDLATVFTLSLKPEDSALILKSENKSNELINKILKTLQESQFDGVELNFGFAPKDGVSKESYGQFVKTLSKTLSSDHHRVKREGYDVVEKLQDDITTVSYSTQSPKNSTSKPQSIKNSDDTKTKSNRKTRDEKHDESEENKNVTSEESIIKELTTELFKEDKSTKENQNKTDYMLFVRLSVEPETVAKKYDLKILSRYADLLIAPTHNIVNSNEDHLTYHPSRLMGLSDMYNTDSILDFLTGIGGLKSKIVITIPATVLKFQLTDLKKNTPKSPSSSGPQVVDQSQLCSLFAKNNWTLERDEDLTAPYAYSGKTWLAFEDEISVNIKGKYILLRELAGGAIYPVDADVNDESCTNRTGSGGYLTSVLYNNFRNLGRKPRALVLESLQEEIHDSTFSSIEAGVKLSEYRIVRVVDHSGAVHVIRKNTKTQFECSRQGYFSHPLGCNKFYRCVKFDQYSDEFTVFEYDCPAGLAFDERWEVCVWPGSLPHGAPCTGSSEIAPVPRSHYQCPNQEGYYADPENCRWFFACLDHARDGITPLTAYEFRCPFGLVFDEEKLACDWPWLVGSCGNKGAAGYLAVRTGGATTNIHSATFINGGNLEASFGQYGNFEQEASFDSFGKGFGTVLKGARKNVQGTYQADQSAGFGYIASQFDDDSNRASFGSLPDFEISGGRISNKGGFVLDQNILGVNAGGAKAQGDRSFQYQSLGAQDGFKGRSNVYNTQQFNTGKSVYQAPSVTLVENSGELAKEQVTVLHPVSTPRPFSVGIPSVQINEEKISDYSSQTSFGSTTPQTSTISSGFSKIAQQSTPHFTVTQPTASIGVSVTPRTEVHSFGQDISQHSGGVSVSTPGVSYGLPVVTPKPQIHQFGQSNIEQGEPALSVGVSVTPRTEVHSFGQSVSQHSGVSGSINSPGVSFSVPVVTPKSQANQFGQGILTGSAVTSVTPRTGVLSVGQSVSQHGGIVGSVNTPKVSFSVPVVTPKSQVHQFGQGVLTGSGEVSLTPKTEIHSFGQSVSQQSNVVGSVSTPGVPYSVPVVTPKSQVYQFGQSIFGQGSSTGSASAPVTPRTEVHSFGQGISQHNSISASTLGDSYTVPIVTPKSTVRQFGQNILTGSAGFSVTPRTEIHTFGQSVSHQNGDVSVSTPEISHSTPVVTPKPQFRHSTIKQSEFSGSVTGGQPLVSVGVPTVTEYRGNGGVSVQGSGVASTVTVTPKPAIQSFDYSGGVFNGVYSSSRPSVSTGSPTVSFIQQNNGFGQNKLFGQSSGVSTAEPRGFKNVNLDQEVILQNVVTEQPVISFGSSPVTPKFVSTQESYESQGGAEFGAKFSTLTPKTVLSGFQPTSIDHEISRELILNQGAGSQSSGLGSVKIGQAGVGATTAFQGSKSEIHTFAQPQNTFSQGSSSGKSSVSFGTSLSPKTNVNVFGYQGGINTQQSGSPVVRVDIPLVTPNTVNVELTNGQNDQTLGGFAGTSYNKPVTLPKTGIDIQGGGNSGQNLVYNVAGVSGNGAYSIDHSGEVFQNSVQPVGKTEFIEISQKGGGIGQQTHSISFNQPAVLVSTVKPFETKTQTIRPASYPKANVLTEVSIEQQPIISVGTISSIGYDKESSTPKAFTPAFSSSPSVNADAVSFKSIFTQPKPSYPSVTTPSPVVSITPTTQVFYEQSQQSFKPSKVSSPAFHKPQQLDVQLTKTNIVSPSPFIHQTLDNSPELVNFEEKQIGFNQGAESFTPVPQVSTPESVSRQYIPAVPKQSSVYLPTVTPVPEVFGTRIQESRSQTPATVFSVKGTERIGLQFNQNSGYLSNQPFVQKTEQRVQNVQYSTPAPAGIVEPKLTIQQSVGTIKSNTDDGFKSAGGDSFLYSSGVQPTTTKSLIIEQQPVHFISQKTYQEKQLLQPIYQQSNDAQLNIVSENINEGHNAQSFNVKYNTPKTVYQENQFVSPVTSKPYVAPISYSTVKNTIDEQGSVFGGDKVSVFPNVGTQNAYTGQKTIQVEGGRKEYVSPIVQKPLEVDQFESSNFSPKNNVLLSVTTSAPVQPFSPLTEEISIQHNTNFDFQKVNKQKEQYTFNQLSTPQPAFKPSGQLFQFNRNFTFERGQSGSQHSINPNIEIPEPPKEYFLQPNIYATSGREYTARGKVNQFRPTSPTLVDYKSSTYLPPEGRKRPSSKATVISFGNVDEKVHEDNIHNILDTYSGGFGNVINNDQFVTKIVKGEGRGEIELGREGSSTVLYEVGSTTPRPRSRGRQYHGSLTSSIPATNKYEEYEIEGQRSFDSESGSKTTIDLKNLKLDKNKKTVIVVSQVSDANPILIGKLAGQCSCQSNMLEIKSKKTNGLRRKNQQQPTEYLPAVQTDTDSFTPSGGPQTVIVGDGKNGIYDTQQSIISSTTTAYSEINSPSILSSLGPDGVLPITPKALFTDDKVRNKKKQFRGRARYLPSAADFGLSIPASEIASTVDYAVLKGDESRTQNEIEGGGASRVLAGAAFDRYGPGGWRGFDETLQGSVDCKRPGLFRHPKYCNKFYACNYDPWKEGFTLHVFNCPIRLTYDSSISACNWPVRGPACADDNLLV